MDTDSSKARRHHSCCSIFRNRLIHLSMSNMRSALCGEDLEQEKVIRSIVRFHLGVGSICSRARAGSTSFSCSFRIGFETKKWDRYPESNPKNPMSIAYGQPPGFRQRNERFIMSYSSDCLSIGAMVGRRRLRWAGKLIRMSDVRLPKLVLDRGRQSMQNPTNGESFSANVYSGTWTQASSILQTKAYV